MSVKRLLAVLSALAVVLLCVSVCYAEGNAALIQGCAWEENMDLYIQGEIQVDALTCKVSNQTAEVLDGGLLTDKDVIVRTTLLLDISTSMPVQMRGSVQDYIDTYIENLNGKEQLRLVTFCEQLNILQDFTSDRYDLANAAAKIEFNGNMSMIYDAIYNTVSEIQPIDGAPCYYRTIIITDGVDEADTGATREELYLWLQAQTYPVDIIAVSAEEQQNPEKDLAALARISGGRYVNLHAASDPAQYPSMLDLENIYWVRVRLPGSVLDGATRQFDLSDGVTTLQFDFKVPIFESTAGIPPQSTSETAAPDPAPEEDSAVGAESQSAPPAGDESGVQEPVPTKNDGLSPAAVIAGAAGVLFVVVLAIVLLMARKARGRKKEEPEEKIRPAAGGMRTVLLPTKEKGFSVRLRNTKDPDQIWNIESRVPVLIGRNPACQICIENTSVSREQCKIYLGEGGSLMLENVSHSNITELNGQQVSAPRKLSEGDQIVCGLITLMVDALSLSDAENGTGNKPIGNATKFINV